MIRKNYLYLLMVLFVGVVLIGLWLSFMDVQQLKESMLQVRGRYLMYAALIYIAAYFIRSYRWNMLIKPIVKLSPIQSWIFSLGSNFSNYLIPLRVGELVKAWFVKKHHGVSMSQSLPSIFIDKSLDTMGILFVLIMMPFIRFRMTSAMLILLSMLILVFVLSLAILIGATKHKKKSERVLSYMFSLLPEIIQVKLNKIISIFISGLNIFEHHWSTLLFVTILTAIGIVLDGLYFYFMFLAFSINLDFILVLFGYTLINLSYALPQPPAQVGSNEWMMVIVFSLGFGLTSQSAGAIMATAHILTALIISIGGTISFTYSGTNLIKLLLKGDNLNES